MRGLRRSYEEYDPEKVEKKSKEFLKRIMGSEKFDMLQKDGKIEIEIESKLNNDNTGDKKTVYELYSDGRVINKTKNQSYCIVADRSDYPLNDMIAIKYSWLIHENDIAERVANKTSLGIGNAVYHHAGYAEYIDYLGNLGWHRESTIIDQNSKQIAYTWNVCKNSTGMVVDIRCPEGMKISIMGVQQLPPGSDMRMAYSLGLYITDESGEEISGYTKVRITKVKPCEDIVQLARAFYQDVKMTKDGESSYRFRQGIEINGGHHLTVHLIDVQNNIRAEDVRFKMEADLWAGN